MNYEHTRTQHMHTSHTSRLTNYTQIEYHIPGEITITIQAPGRLWAHCIPIVAPQKSGCRRFTYLFCVCLGRREGGWGRGQVRSESNLCLHTR